MEEVTWVTKEKHILLKYCSGGFAPRKFQRYAKKDWIIKNSENESWRILSECQVVVRVVVVFIYSLSEF